MTRHRFGPQQLASSGGPIASASNGFRSFYELRQFFYSGIRVGPDWDTDGLLIVSDGYHDVSHSVSVPVNTALFFINRFSHESFAQASGASASAAAAIASLWSFEVNTEADATIVFGVEELLALSPPQLDAVPEPEGAVAAGLLALFGLAARRPGHRARERTALHAASSEE